MTRFMDAVLELEARGSDLLAALCARCRWAVLCARRGEVALGCCGPVGDKLAVRGRWLRRAEGWQSTAERGAP